MINFLCLNALYWGCIKYEITDTLTLLAGIILVFAHVTIVSNLNKMGDMKWNEYELGRIAINKWFVGTRWFADA